MKKTYIYIKSNISFLDWTVQMQMTGNINPGFKKEKKKKEVTFPVD